MKYIMTIILFCFYNISTSQNIEWDLVPSMSDEFNSGTINTNKWNTKNLFGYPFDRMHDETDISDGNLNHELQIYTDNNIIFEIDPVNSSNEFLVLRAIEEKVYYKNSNIYYSDPGTPRYEEDYSSGYIETTNNYQYGKYEIRCKVPNGKGFWPAFWLFGGCEIDVFEFMNDPTPSGSGRQSNIVGCGYHAPNYTDRCHVSYPDNVDYSLDFHIYTLIWTPEYLKFLIDNQVKWFMDNTMNGFPTCNAKVIFNLAIQNRCWVNGIETSCAPDGNTIFPADFTIDYFRYYTQNENCKSFIITDSQTDTEYSGNYIDLAIPKDVDYNGIYEEHWEIGSEFKYVREKTVANGSELTVRANERIIIHAGFEAEEGSKFEATLVPCLSSERLSNENIEQALLTNSSEEINFSIYPNPTNDMVYIKHSDEEGMLLQIFDIFGRKIYEGNLVKKFDLSNNPDGIYFFKLTSKNSNLTYKLLKN